MTIVIVAVGALTWAAIEGVQLLPTLIVGSAASPPVQRTLNIPIALTNIFTLLLLWRRGRSMLDLWLMVAVCVLIAEALLLTYFVQARYILGFYGIRIIALVVSKVVLVVLLSETVMLQARLSAAIRKLERERENRLTTVGAVVAAIAHEVRQPLTAMTTNASAGQRFLDRASPDIAEAKDIFDKIKDAGFRASEVFENVLGLFRGDKKEHQPVNVNTLALEAIQLLRNELDDHNIVAHTILESDLPAIEGNRGQLREVILNLVQNSIEAMAATTKQRRINVETARYDSRSISISLQDTGPGIDPNKLASIFDPFVTTKAKGTGMGLAICKMIIEQHGGKLSASSDAQHGGARFEITLPVEIAEPPPQWLLRN